MTGHRDDNTTRPVPAESPEKGQTRASGGREARRAAKVDDDEKRARGPRGPFKGRASENGRPRARIGERASKNGPGGAAWAAAQGGRAGTIAQSRDADAPLAARALEVVRAFIAERGLILYGGLAIDQALRLKGGGIYPEGHPPDYDCYSPRSVDDAYDLAERLAAAGFPLVGAIPAIHQQTMRVKTDFVFVADISYAPPAVFARLPTLAYRGLRVLHPDYQRADMHLAFCFPFNAPPREDVFHRFPKDLQRFRLFQEHYPVAPGRPLNAAPGKSGGGAAAAVSAELDLGAVAVHGYAAFGLLRRAFDQLAAACEAGGALPAAAVAAARAAAPPEGGLLPAPVALRPAPGGRHRVIFTPPAGASGALARLQVAAFRPAETAAALAAARGGGGHVEWLAPYMDTRPLAARVAGGGAPPVDVYSTRNRLLAASAVSFPLAEGGHATVRLATPQYLLLGFLHDAQAAAAPAERDLCLAFYAATLRLLDAAGRLYGALEAKAEAGGEGGAAAFAAFADSGPFGLVVRTFGAENLDSSFLIRLAGSAKAVGDAPPGVDPADLPDLARVPAKYHPRLAEGVSQRAFKTARPPPFDYEASPAFQRDGRPVAGPAAGERGRARRAEGGAPPSFYVARGSEGASRRAAAALVAAGWARLSRAEALAEKGAGLCLRFGGAPPGADPADSLMAFDLGGLRGGDAAGDEAALVALVLAAAPGALAPGTALLAADAGEPSQALEGGPALWRAPGQPPVAVETPAQLRAARAALRAARIPAGGVLSPALPPSWDRVALTVLVTAAACRSSEGRASKSSADKPREGAGGRGEAGPRCAVLVPPAGAAALDLRSRNAARAAAAAAFPPIAAAAAPAAHCREGYGFYEAVVAVAPRARDGGGGPPRPLGGGRVSEASSPDKRAFVESLRARPALSGEEAAAAVFFLLGKEKAPPGAPPPGGPTFVPLAKRGARAPFSAQT